MISRVGSYLSQSVYSVATPFHPFGGAVDIIVVQQQDGSFRSTPWYVRFGKFQGVLKGAEKVVKIEVNGVEADFHMFLDNSGEAYFIKEITPEKDNGVKDDDFAPESQKDDFASESQKDGFAPESQKDGFAHESQKDDFATDSQKDDFAPDSQNNYFAPESQKDDFALESQKDYFAPESQKYHFAPESQKDDFAHESQKDYFAPESKKDDFSPESQKDHFAPECQKDYFTPESLKDDFAPESQKDDLAAESQKDDFAPEKENNAESTEPENEKRFYEFQDDLSDFGPNRYDDNMESNNSEVVLFSVDGQILSAPITSMEEGNTENVQLSTPQFHLGPVEGPEFEGDLDLSNESTWAQYLSDIGNQTRSDVNKEDVFKSCLALNDLGKIQDESEGVKKVESLKLKVENGSIRVKMDQDCEESERVEKSSNGPEIEDGVENGSNGPEVEELQPYYDDNGNFDGPKRTRIELSLCGNLLRPGIGLTTATETFNAHRIPEEQFKLSASSIIKNDSLIVKIQEKYFTWEKVAHIVLGMAAYGLEIPVDPTDAIPVDLSGPTTPSGRRWRLWPIPFRRAKTLDINNSNVSGEDVFLDSESVFDSPQAVETTPTRLQSPQKQFGRTHVPTNEQISSLGLKDGQNIVSFIFSTRVLGVQKVDAHIYLWKWNARIVISDVDGTITKSDVLGQFMPLVGKDWTQSGVARLFSAIKENGYQLLFLSARAIVQAYLTRSFLINLKQDGKALPNGPVVISPDGLFPSLFREVIRRAPHEFKIACLEDIKALFPSDYNPFYAGFGNRDTDELSYRKIGIPKGKIFIINPKGEVAISHRVDMKGKSYTSLHTLVNDMFPPTSMVEQEDYNSWNYWRVPLPDVEL